jgi:transglutaminase-like putative cysteine protease
VSVPSSSSERGPDSLLPLGVARLLGFAALASLAALEWQRLVAGLGSGRALLWVLVATAAGAAVLASDRLPPQLQSTGTLAAGVGGLIAAVLVSGIELDLMRPRAWPDLVEGVVGGAQSLGTVRLPYAGADPWPRATLELLGSVLLACAALLAFWPRVRGRGYPFLALAALLVLAASPVVSLGGTRPLVLGAAIAALTVCFLWLERLPLRPGAGVAALLGLALAGALPLAAVADRGEPWFDYRAFAEGLGPDDPVRFSWNQDYGPIDWPRDGNEVMRITSDAPLYWKAANLEEFDGREWRDAGPDARGGDDFESELRDDWRNRPGWQHRIDVSIRRIRTSDVVAPGTITGVRDATSPLRPSGEPGRWVADAELRRGDSYTADVYVPAPSASELRQAGVMGSGPARDEELQITVPFLPRFAPTARELGAPGDLPLASAVVQFPAFDEPGEPFARYPTIQRSDFDADRVLRRSGYRRTWQLAERLRAGAETPFEYVLGVNAYLRSGFGYTERPAAPAPGRLPLDAFLIDDKEGYCQHFAGAMALLLRMGGVPARVVTGFSPGGYSERRDAWIVRDTDAHAWVEAWFDELGWVTLDPTPPSTPARSQIAALEAPAEPEPATPSAADDAAGGAGQAQRPGGLRADLLRDVDPVGAEPAGGGGDRGIPWWALGALFAAAALAAAGVVRGVHRHRALGPLSPLDRAIAELESALRRSGRPAPPGTTLRQLEQRLGGSPEATAYLRALSAGRYGSVAALPTPAQRRAMRRALASGLGPTGRVRALWALPPRRGGRAAGP